MPEQWKESVNVLVCKNGDNTDRSNYTGISILSATYKILANILLSRLTPYAEEIIGDRQVNQNGLNINGTHHLLVYADYFKILGGSFHTIQENAEAF